MRRSQKTAAVTIPLILSALALGGYAYSRTHAAPTYRLASGIEVTPSVNTNAADVTARLLEVKSWNFDLVRPDTHKPLYISFVSYGNGKPNKVLNGGFWYTPGSEHPSEKSPSQVHLALTLRPLGDSFFGAKQIKYIMDTGEGTLSSTMPNPIFQGSGLTSEIQVVSADNVILLLSTNHTKSYISGNMADNDTNLALCITETPPH